MGAEPEIVTFVVRLVAEGAGRVAGVVERVRRGEKGRSRDIKAIDPLVAAMLKGDAEDGEAPRLGG